MILWPLFIASLTTLGVPSALIYHLRHHPEQRANLVTNAFIMATVMGVVSSVITAFILPFWLHQYSPTIVRFAEIFLVTVPLCSVTLAGRAALEAEHDFSGSNAIQILTPLSTLIVLLGLLALHRLELIYRRDCLHRGSIAVVLVDGPQNSASWNFSWPDASPRGKDSFSVTASVPMVSICWNVGSPS